MKISFDQFYEIYPRKENRRSAEKAWGKIPDNMKQQIIDDVKNRILNHEKWKDKDFIPHPSTYLNGKRWQDEIMPYRDSGKNKSRFDKTVDTLSILLNKA